MRPSLLGVPNPEQKGCQGARCQEQPIGHIGVAYGEAAKGIKDVGGHDNLRTRGRMSAPRMRPGIARRPEIIGPGAQWWVTGQKSSANRAPTRMSTQLSQAE